MIAMNASIMIILSYVALVPGAPPIRTDRPDDWTTSINNCRSYLLISDLQNSYGETCSEFLMVKFEFSTSNSSPRVPSGALGALGEIIHVGLNRIEDVEINN